MFFYDGLSCPHCHTPFGQTDDIVACPVCGAPHHRDCWMENGGCSCAAEHGTDKQWSRENAKTTDNTAQADEAVAARCPNCGADNSPFAEICSHCGCSLSPQEWHSPDVADSGSAPSSSAFNEYSPFHTHAVPCGGVDPHADIEGESAEDLAAVVQSNAAYYLPRFQRMAVSGSKVSFNWAALFLPSYWLLFRKQYLAGGIAILFELLYSLAVSLISLRYFPTAFEKDTYPEMSEEITRILLADEHALMAVMLLMMLMLAVGCMHLIVGLFGNRLYMKSCLKIIRTTRQNYPEGYHAQLALLGGASFVLALIGYLATPYIASFLLMLIS